MPISRPMTLRAAALTVLLLALASCSSSDGEACRSDSDCPLDFACINNVCLPRCSDADPCPSGQVCIAGVCRATEQDAGTSDRGADPAGDGPAGTDTREEPSGDPRGIGPDGQPIYGAIAGESCGETSDCRSGLICEADHCEAAGETTEGEPCAISAECADGLACSLTARCAASDGRLEGQTCTLPNQCAEGLRCTLLGAVGTCQPEGLGDIGADCEGHPDCLSPLLCSADGRCQIPIFGGATLIQPSDCAPSAEATDPFKVYFEVPRESPPAEFYRLPYPNDIRRTDEGVDLSGHYNPGLAVLGGEIVDRYLTAIETSGRGFSPTPAVFFRFSRAFDFGSIQGGGDEPTLNFVDIDPDSPRFGRRSGMGWYMTTGRGNFICQNYLAVRPSWRAPLAHGTTYAVYLTDGIRSDSNEPPVQDDDLAAVLSAERPDDPHLGPAWDAYEDFRDYLAVMGFSPESIMAAAVFTVMEPEDQMPVIRSAIRGRAITPRLNEIVLCDEDVESPCDDGEGRVCLNQGEDYYELHATYQAPIYQAGTRPYLTADDGGNLIFGDDGSIQTHGSEQMCLLLSIPRGEMPDGGWPVVLYAHGTGGDFLTPARNGLADRLANISLGGDGVEIATASIDGVAHAGRRGGSELDPQVLFFNFANPLASLGNVQQGAADYFFLTWLLEQIDVDAANSPTGAAIQFDPAQFYFYGHSQGATVGVPFVAHEPGIRGAVLSGAGGGLLLGLLEKTSPVDVAGAVALVLNENSDPSDLHPFLSLLQQYMDPVDPLSYARSLITELPEGGTPKHLFISYGLGDTYTPNITTEVLATAAGAQLVEPAVTEIDNMRGVALPVSGNLTAQDESRVTAIMVTYEPAQGLDGHFVMFRNEEAIEQTLMFLGTAVRDGVPEVDAVE